MSVMEGQTTDMIAAFLRQNALIILTLTVAVYYILGPYLDPKRRRLPPGPTGIPILGYLPFLPHNYIPKFQQLFKKYGKMFCLRLGSADVVFISDYDILKKIGKMDAYSNRPRMALFENLLPTALGNRKLDLLLTPLLRC